MPFASRRQQRFAFATRQPWAKRWAAETDFSGLPETKRKKKKDAPLHGPGGLLGFAGLGTKKRTKALSVTTKPMSRSEAARVAALARWGKYTPHAKPPKPLGGAAVAPLKQPKVKPLKGGPKGGKGGKGGKGRAGAKPKPTPEQRAADQQARQQEREQQRDAEQTANRAAVDKQLGFAEDTVGALDDLRAGKPVDDDGGLVKLGLAEQAQDGSYRLTPAGRALVAARNAGDAGRARDTMSRARDALAARNARRAAAVSRAMARAAKPKPAKGGGGKKKQPQRPTGMSVAQRARIARAQQRIAQAAERLRRRKPSKPDRIGRVPQTIGTKAQTAQDRAMFAKMGGGKGAGGGYGGKNTLWSRGPSGKRTPQADAGSKGDSGGSGGSSKPSSGGRLFAAPAKGETKRERIGVTDVAARTNSDGTTNYSVGGRPTTSRSQAEKWIRQNERTHAQAEKRREADEKRRIEASNRRQAEADRRREVKQRDADRHAVDRRIESLTRKINNGDDSARTRQALERAQKKRRDLLNTKSFAVYKDAAGNHRWLSHTTTAYRDRDREILSTRGLEANALRMTRTGQYGPLRYWHIGQPDGANVDAPWGPGLDIGDCDFSMLIGRTLVESGTFRSQHIAEKMAAMADEHEMSPGFLHDDTQPDADKAFDEFFIFERSAVPTDYARASNLFTRFQVKEQRMKPEEFERRLKVAEEKLGLTAEQTEHERASLIATDKAAQERRIAYKSEEADDPVIYLDPAGEPGIIFEGRFVTLKAAMPPEEMEEAGESELDDGMEEEMGEASAAPGLEQVATAVARAVVAELLPHLNIADKVNELKSAMAGYTKTKDDAQAAAEAQRAQEVAALQAQIAEQQQMALTLQAKLKELTDDQPSAQTPPSNADGDVVAALKSAGPTNPTDPSAPQLPPDASPLQQAAARLMPALYTNTPQGAFQGWIPPTPLPPQQS